MFVQQGRREQTRWRPETGLPVVPRGAMAAVGGAETGTHAILVQPRGLNQNTFLTFARKCRKLAINLRKILNYKFYLNPVVLPA